MRTNSWRSASNGIKILNVNCEPFFVVRDDRVEQKFDDIEAGGARRRHTVRATNSELDRTIWIIFLLYHRIIIDDILQTIAGNVGEGKRNESSGGDETVDFLSFSDGL
jgi:hypothetical protein